MNKTVAIILAVLAFAACFTMYYLGSNDSKLTELKDFWYIPLPLAIVFLLIGFKQNKKA